MSPQQEEAFVINACQRLMERGWLPGEEFEPSSISAQEITSFEREYQLTLPSLYKTFLTSYHLPRRASLQICSILEDEDGGLDLLWTEIHRPNSMGEVAKRMEILQQIREFCDLPEDCFRNLIPIGDWGAGWGPLCLDLSRPEDKVDKNDMHTWSLVWFDHEVFDWDKQYLCNDGFLHGSEALPDFKTLLELYFYGALEDRFAREAGIKPTYEWYLDSLKR